MSAHAGDGFERGRRRCGGFTLMETLIATGVASIVMTALFMTFVWVYDKSSHASHVSCSENTALASASKITDFLRNAQRISAIDTQNWMWVEITRTNGTKGRLVYVDPLPTYRNGYLYLSNSVGTAIVLVATGVTKIMQPGLNPPVFQMSARSNVLYVAYRVVEPVPSAPGQQGDQLIAAIVDMGVCLRNAPR